MSTPWLSSIFIGKVESYEAGDLRDAWAAVKSAEVAEVALPVGLRAGAGFDEF